MLRPPTVEQPSTSRAVDLQTWEQAERERSAFEAAHTAAADEELRPSQKNVTRYMSPPAQTPFALEYAYHLLGDVRGKTVVDFGCGTGENTLLLVLRGADVHAVDISPELIEIGKRRLLVNDRPDGARFIAASVYEIPLPDASVDVVFGMAILHHLELPLAAREVKRILKPGGRAIFSEPVRNSRLLRFIRSLIPYRAPDVSPFERPLTEDEITSFTAGFRVSRSRAFDLPYLLLAARMPIVRNYMTRLTRFDSQIIRRFPWLGRQASVRVFEMVR